MDYDQCMAILDRYKDWNPGQRSVRLCMTGERTEEDDILDERRALLKAATKRLRELVEGEDKS